MKQVIISGGSGLVGRHLTGKLKQAGYNVSILTRSQTSVKDGVEHIHWDPDNNVLEQEIIDSSDVVINLAGKNIFDIWTEKNKKEIHDSRIRSTELLVNRINKSNKDINFISTSGINYYGNFPPYSVKEDAFQGNDFLARVCKDWEEAAKKCNKNTCIARLGIVLDKEGGMLKILSGVVRLGMGAPLGSGEQHLSWIHINDQCRAMIFMEQNKLSGIFNLVAPNPVKNREMVKKLAGILGKPTFLPAVPSLFMKALPGGLGELILADMVVSPEKIRKKGFNFEYPFYDEAVKSFF